MKDMNTIKITRERLKELFLYDPDSGFFFRRKKIGGVPHDFMLTGSKNAQGYIAFGVDYKLYTAHRLAWLYMTGEMPSGEIDHINHIRADNSYNNLRVVSHKENNKNTTINKNNKSGVMGICFDNDLNKWRAYIVVNGKLIHLGCNKNIKTLITIRKAAECWFGFHKNHGE